MFALVDKAGAGVYPPLMLEKLRDFIGLPKTEKKKGFIPTEEMLFEITQSLISDPSFRDRLLFLANLPSKSRKQFRAEESTAGVRVMVGEGKSSKDVFILGIGSTFAFYLNKFTLEDAMIYKSKPNADIGSRDELVKTVEDFIRSDTLAGDLGDIRKESLEKRMNAGREESRVPLNF